MAVEEIELSFRDIPIVELQEMLDPPVEFGGVDARIRVKGAILD